MSHDGFKCLKCGYKNDEWGTVVCPKCGFNLFDDSKDTVFPENGRKIIGDDEVVESNAI